MRIWFNRGFSLAPIAAAMRESDSTLEVFVSVGADHPHHDGPSATWLDPDVNDDAYVAWVADMVTLHRIDILIPTRRRRLLAAAGLACRVELPASAAVLDQLEDKYAFAASLVGEPFHLDSRLVTSTQALSDAIASFATAHPDMATPCVKPRRGVNGHGFWRLMRDRPMSHLDRPEDGRIMDRLYVAAAGASEAAGTFQDLVLMEYLPGPEVSVDVLAHRGMVLKMAARTKSTSGGQRIQTQHFLTPEVTRLIARFALHGVVNVQFRQAGDGTWKLLEINARPAGGIVYSEAVGCGLLADWAAVLTGRTLPAEVRQASIDTHIRLTTAVTQLAA